MQELIKEIKRFLKSTYWLTPLNLESEQRKFLLSKDYNPQLIYPNLQTNKLNEYLLQLEKIKVIHANKIESRITNNKIQELILKIRLLLTRGTPQFSNISLELYQCRFPSKILLEAKKDATLKEEFKNQENLDAVQTVKKIKKYLLEVYQTSDWTVKVSELTDFYIRINSSKKLILVSKSINWDFCDLDNTFAHEIDGHLIRAINASQQQNPLFRIPLPFYIKTEEGLASYLGDYFSTTANLSRKHHALKYLAGYLALNKSFREVYQFFLNSGFTPPLAFQRTFRLKRGFVDTAMPGCYGREAMYYEGIQEVKDYLESGGSTQKLYAGKIGLKDIDIIPIPKDEIIPLRLIENTTKNKTNVLKYSHE